MIKDYLNNKYKEENYVWFLRQAGRYLPEYKLIRKTEKDFLSLCNNVDKATNISLQPIERFNLDSAIVFSDILVIPALLGQKVVFTERYGPMLENLDHKLINSMNKKNVNFKSDINTYEVIKKIRGSLDKKKGLIGFCGAPWTIACYMIDGSSKQNFIKSKSWIKTNKTLLLELLDIIGEVSVNHLLYQGESGCDSLMIFDSWASLVPEDSFDDIIIAPTKKIISKIKKTFTTITYPKGIGHKIISFDKHVQSNVLGVDHHTDLNWLLKNISSSTVLQGNLNPHVLREGGHKLVSETEKILEMTKQRKHIFNVGHGIIKDTPVENVYKVLDIIRRS